MANAVAILRRAVFTRRNALTATVMAVLLLATLVLPDGVIRYATYLTVFSIWMVGFVLTVVEFLRLYPGTG